MTYLVLGTRSPGDVVTYPDHDRRLIFDPATGGRGYETLDGAPAEPLKVKHIQKKPPSMSAA